MAMANESDVQQLIAEGTGALRRGDKATARTLLTRALEQDDRNEQIWLWLSGAVDSPEEQRICLENVLVLNPESDIARRGLALLDQQTGGAPPAPAPAPSASPPAMTTAAAPPDQAATPAWAAAPAAPAPPPAAPAWPPAGSIFGNPPAISDEVLPGWMDHPGGDQTVPPPATPAPPLPPNGSIFGNIPETTDSILPGWMDQSTEAYAAAPPAPATPEPPPPMVGGAAANWANVVTSLRGNEAFQAVPPPEPEVEPPSPPAYGGGYAPGAPEAMPAWASAAQAAAPPAWPPADHSAAPDPALSGIQPFQVPTEIGSPAPPAANDPFGGLFNAPPSAPSSYPAQSSEGASGYEGYGTAPAASYDPNMYAGGDTSYERPASADSFQFGTSDPYGAGEYTSPDGPGLLANLAGYDVGGHNYGSSPALIGRPPLSRTPVTPTIPCPNCGELVTESALSCPRCNFRFYAPCPNCGEYIDTGDPSPTGKDVCPRCATPVDKLALGRAGVRVAGRGSNPREAMLAATRAQKAHKETATQAAPTEVKPRRRSSGAAVLLVLIILVVVGLLAAYQFHVEPVYGLLQPLLSSAATITPTPTAP